MCGIVGYIGERDVVPVLLSGLEKLEYRGYDSAGVAVYNGEEVDVVKTKGRLQALRDKLAEEPISGYLGIGHTRWATHGAPSDANSHPHVSQGERIAVVHNGIIENYMHLKTELERAGYRFVSETDTETAAHLIDYYYKSGMDLLDAVYKAIDRIDGSYALGVVCEDFPGRLIAARKDSPLIVGLGEGENFIASDMPAILEYTRNVYLLNDYEVADISANAIQIYDRDKKEVNKDVFTVDWNVEAAEKGGYDHFMLKEINEQGKVVKDTISPHLGADGIQFESFKLDKATMRQYNKICIVACGTAYYAGLVGKHLIEHLCRIPVEAQIASEFRYNDPIIDGHTLMIVVSQSGETADTLAAVRLAKEKKARVLAIVNVVGSSITREADDVLYTVAGPEIAVASTKAFSSQIAMMYILAAHMALITDKMTKEAYQALKLEMEELPILVDRILKRSHKIEKFTQKYLDAKNVFYIGRGLDFSIALEGSLKLKEVAYLHSEPYAAGELKHGPIALIEKSTLIMGVITQERLFEKTVANIKECKARGARILAICMEGNKDMEDYADDVFYIPRTNSLLAPLLANIPQQLFAYYMAVGLGNDVDKPRNLAKSVTVE